MQINRQNLLLSLDRPSLISADQFAEQFVAQGKLSPRTTAFIHALAEGSPLGSSPIHGFRHWLAVQSNGLEILRASGECYDTPFNRKIVSLFALFHDIKREDDGHCVEHGMAGAMNLRSLFDGIKALFDVDDLQIAIVAYACQCHTLVEGPVESLLLRHGSAFTECGMLNQDGLWVIGACLDADRLDLGRVGISPNGYYLSTNAAREFVKQSRS